MDKYKGTGKNSQQNANAEGVTGSTTVTPDQPANNSSQEQRRGADMISQAGTKVSETAAATPSQTSADANKSASSKVEPSGSETGTEVPNDWTTESAYKEIKKLREENKQYRLKYGEQLDKFKQDAEARIQAKDAEAKILLEKAKELDKLKEEQEDKKRDLSERLAVRESKLTEMQTLMKIQEERYSKMLAERDAKLMEHQADINAQSEVAKGRLTEELNKIPEQYREYANLLVKGAGDPRDALIALNEARLKGMFEDKTVIVNHSTPGARDGARASQERLQEVERQNRASMTPGQKVKMALEQIKGGQTNNAFRTK